MDHISSLLSKVVAKRGLTKHVDAAFVAHRTHFWLKENLPDLLQEFTVKTFKDAVLKIEANHSIAVQELHMQKQDLLDFLRETCEGVQIEDIKIVRS